jgi:hypothetical protein
LYYCCAVLIGVEDHWPKPPDYMIAAWKRSFPFLSTRNYCGMANRAATEPPPDD